MLFLGSVGFFVLGHRPVSHTVAGGAGRTEGPFISADKALAVTLAAFGFRGFVHHADASTALIAPTTDSVSRARVSFRSMPASSSSSVHPSRHCQPFSAISSEQRPVGKECVSYVEISVVRVTLKKKHNIILRNLTLLTLPHPH